MKKVILVATSLLAMSPLWCAESDQKEATEASDMIAQHLEKQAAAIRTAQQGGKFDLSALDDVTLSGILQNLPSGIVFMLAEDSARVQYLIKIVKPLRQKLIKALIGVPIVEPPLRYNTLLTERGVNILFDAIVNSKPATVEYILRLGLKPPYLKAKSIFILAAQRYKTPKGRKILQLLADADVGKNARDDEQGATALHYAVQDKEVELVKMLLAYNVAVDVRNRYGKTPLDLALMHKETPEDKEIIRLLEEAGAAGAEQRH